MTSVARVATTVVFYPRSPCGERPGVSTHCKTVPFFYPRSPCGERPEIGGSNQSIISFLSTLSLRRATEDLILDEQIEQFSIHALLAESDTVKFKLDFINQDFLSTLSLRRATRAPPYNLMIHQIFYPRSPCGERQPALHKVHIITLFYPRSPCGERH